MSHPSPVPLAALSPAYRGKRSVNSRLGLGRARARGRLWLWGGGTLFALCLYFGVLGLWHWKHVISSSGGRYFVQRVVLPVPAFQQDDPRWTFDLLGPTIDTLGQQGCAVTSAAMILAFYGFDTDPRRLNQYLTTHGGYTERGWLEWEKASDLAAGGLAKAYEDLPSYALIDQNLLDGNPVIVRLTLRNGTTHFVVIVGKAGWDYLIQDPARAPSWGVYPLRDLASRIEALRFYRLAPAGFANASF